MSEPAADLARRDAPHYPEDMQHARVWIDDLRTQLNRERAYIQRLEGDVSLLRDAVDTVLAQGQLHKTTMRRILRLAAAACSSAVHQPYEITPLPDWRLEQITTMHLRHKGWVR